MKFINKKYKNTIILVIIVVASLLGYSALSSRSKNHNAANKISNSEQMQEGVPTETNPQSAILEQK